MRIFIIALLFLTNLSGGPAFSAEVSFQESYKYDAGEADSKLSCRAFSLVEIKRLLLERLGAYIESKSTVVDMQLTKDEVTTFSAGIVKTEILQEEWDGKQYSMIARIVVDPSEVAQLVSKIKSNPDEIEKVRKLEAINAEAALQINELQANLANLQTNVVNLNRNQQRAQKIINAWGSYQRGIDLRFEGNYEESLEALNIALQSNQNYLTYYQRGRTHMKLNNYRKAVADFDKSIELNARMKNAYFFRGKAYRKLGEKRKGIKDIKEAARQGSKMARQHLESKGKSY